MKPDNDYTAAGFDGFLSRSIDNQSQVNLNSNFNPSNQLPFDRSQVTGQLGDTFRTGETFQSGSEGNYSVSDGKNLRVVMGKQTDGTQGITISKEGFDADIKRPNHLLFNSQQSLFQVAIANSYIFPAVTVANGTSTTQSFSIDHNIQGIPGFLVYFYLASDQTANHTGFPGFYYTQMHDTMSVYEPNNALFTSTYGLGIDEHKLYINRTVTNAGPSPSTSTTVNIKYYIFQQSITE